MRTIAGQYEVSKSALQRHKEGHIPKNLLRAKEAKEICQAEKIFNKLVTLKRDAARITKKAKIDGALKVALYGDREQSRVVGILAKIEGQIRPPQIDLTVNNLTLLKINDRLSRKVEEINETNG